MQVCICIIQTNIFQNFNYKNKLKQRTESAICAKDVLVKNQLPSILVLSNNKSKKTGLVSL